MGMLVLTLLALSRASITRHEETLEAETIAEIEAKLFDADFSEPGYFSGLLNKVTGLTSAITSNLMAFPKIKECRSLMSLDVFYSALTSSASSIKSLLGSITSLDSKLRFLLGQTRNPFIHIAGAENVMDISRDIEDLEELDMRPKDNRACVEDHCVLAAGALMKNLEDMPPKLVAQIWLRRTGEAKLSHRTFVDWLKAVANAADTNSLPAGSGWRLAAQMDSQRTVRRSPAGWPGLAEFVAEIKEHVRDADEIVVENPAPSRWSGSEPVKPVKEDTLAEVKSVFTKADNSGENLVVSSKTSMWDDPYWRTRLLEAMWPHADHIGGYMIRTALGTIGEKPGDEKVRGQALDVNQKLMSQNSAFNAYSDKPVVAWGELDGELMDKLWSQAAPLYRELGLKNDDEYIVAFTLRGMKAGGLLDRSGKGLPGPIWHKDVFADYVIINYPFCFLPGYNNEVADIYNYEKVDPGSGHLAKFTEDVENTVMVRTVQEGATEGFGEMIGFNNAQSRHRARPPLDATREAIEGARMTAKDWGVPDNAVRAMIHMTVRKKSWTDIAEAAAFRIPDFVGKWLGPVVKCAQQVPIIEQYWFNEYGGFIDRSNRTYNLN